MYDFDTEDSILPDFEKPVGGKKQKRTKEEEYFALLGEAMREEGEVEGDGDILGDDLLKEAMEKEAALAVFGGN